MLRALPLIGVLVLVPASASAQQRCTTSDARHVVNSIYANLLQRAADRGSDAHVQGLRSGEATVRDVVAAVVKSAEYDREFLPGSDRPAAVRNLYRHLLGREVDENGLRAHSEALLDQGKDSVIDTILNSSEYQQKYGANGVPGSQGLFYCRPERALGTAGAARRAPSRAADANRDGVITLSEWRGTREEFRSHDWNRDNLLSGDEVREALQPGAVGTSGFGGRDGALDSRRDGDFDDLDFDRDGRIDEAEWLDDYDEFDRMDRNRDGFVTRREFSRTNGTTGR